MSNVDKLIEKVKNAKDESNEFWFQCYMEMKEIINGNYSSNEKDKLLNLGIGEMILMMYDGIKQDGKIKNIYDYLK